MPILNQTDIINKSSGRILSPDEVVDTSKKELTWGETAKGFITNAPASYAKYFQDTVSSLLHPVDTAKGINTAIGGAYQKALKGRLGDQYDKAIEKYPPYAREPIETQNRVAEAIADKKKQDYGSVRGFKNYLATDPAGVMSDASLVTGGGAGLAKIGGLTKTANVLSIASKFTNPVTQAITVAKPVLKATGKVGSQVLGRMTTGMGKEAVDRAWEGTPAFKNAMEGNVSQEDLLGKSKDALNVIKENRAKSYVDELSKVKEYKRSLDISNLTDSLETWRKKFNVKLTDEGLDFSRSVINKKDAGAFEEIYTMVKDWGSKPQDRTPIMMDVLKRRLDDFYSDSSGVRAMTSSLRNDVKKTIVNSVPEYSKMVGDYEKSTGLIKEIEKTLSLNNKASPDTALRKLNQALRENFEYRRDLVKILEEQGGANIMDELAGLSAESWTPRGLVGKLTGGGAGILTVMHGLSPKLALMLAASSPRAVGEFVYLLGKTKNIPFNKAAIPANVAYQVGQLKQEESENKP